MTSGRAVAAKILKFTTISTLALAVCGLSSCGWHHDNKKPVKHPKKGSASHGTTAKPAAKPAPHAESETTSGVPSKSTETHSIEATGASKEISSDPGDGTSVESVKKTAAKKPDYPVGIAVPGRNDVVLSPYNKRQVTIDPEKMPSGKLVNDPTYPISEKKFFRIP